MTENCYLMLLLLIKIFNSLKRTFRDSTPSEAFQNSFLRECVAFSNFHNKRFRGQIFFTIFKKNKSYNYFCIILKAIYCLFYIWVVYSVIFLCQYVSEMILKHTTFVLKIIELKGN